jgi:DNA repair protein RadD
MPARDYQVLAAQSIWDYFTAGKTGNPLVVMPTGTGKSHVIAEFLKSVLYHFPYQRIQIVTHVKELIEQDYKKLLDAWPTAPVGIYSAGLKRKDIHDNIVFGGIASMAKKAHAFGHVDLMLIDEAHLVSPNEKTMYRKYIADLKKVNPALKVIGFTATDWRLGSGKLVEEDDPLFTDVCFDMTTVEAFNWLFAQGYLLPLVPRKPKVELDVSGVHMRGGEFIQQELQNAVDKHDITVKALQEAITIAQEQGRHKWLIFASGVEHAVHIAEILNELGVPAGAVHSKMSGQERDAILASHKSGTITAIANNNILTTGYDDPEIDLILVLRPTASSVLWVQMLGRGTRPVFADGYDLSTQVGRLAAIAASQKQNCLVLDYAGNTRRLGPINDPVIPNKKGKGSGTAPVKCCDHCDTYNHASARFCFLCGAEFTFAVKIKQASSTETLVRGELPVVEVFEVHQITYQQYHRAGKPPMLRVSYFCGLRKFDEYVCLEHVNFAGKKARDWWRKRTNLPVPDSVAMALTQTDKVAQPTHLRVWVNKAGYPEIMDVDFTGTAFGKREAVEPPVVTVGSRDALPEFDDDKIPWDTPTQSVNLQDDEIPF